MNIFSSKISLSPFFSKCFAHFFQRVFFLPFEGILPSLLFFFSNLPFPFLICSPFSNVLPNISIQGYFSFPAPVFFSDFPLPIQTFQNVLPIFSIKGTLPPCSYFFFLILTLNFPNFSFFSKCFNQFSFRVHSVFPAPPLVGSFTKIRTSSKVIRIYLAGKAIKIPLK